MRLGLKYCPWCQTELKKVGQAAWRCEECQQTEYLNPRPCVELILKRDGKVLASERGREPFKGSFDFPGGFVELHEDLITALYREVEEELNIAPDGFGKLEFLTSFNTPYVFGKNVYYNLVSVFVAELDKSIEPNVSDDVASVRWIGWEEISDVSWTTLAHMENAARALRLVH